MESSFVKSLGRFFESFFSDVKCSVKKYNLSIDSFEGFRTLKCQNNKKASFIVLEERQCHLAIESYDNSYYLLSIHKNNSIFSSNETKMLAFIVDAIKYSYIFDEMDSENALLQMGIEMFPKLLVAQCMQGTNKKRWSGVFMFLNPLIQLTYQKYEMATCSSGIICVKDVKLFLDNLDKDIYGFIPMEKNHIIDADFFKNPASYRYVDGKNCFYLCGRNHAVNGLLYIKEPQRFGIIERCNGKHISHIFDSSSVKWIAYNGFNNDVVLYTKEVDRLKFIDNHWIIRDLDQLSSIIKKYSTATEEFANKLAEVVVALSELHMGSLMVVLNERKLPEMTGKIDKSSLANSLYQTINNQTIYQLIKFNRILGILSSDGLTSFDRLGKIVDCGSIIELKGETNVVGGGRTQAATIASKYGLAIKVSEDGPITIFKNEQKIYSF